MATKFSEIDFGYASAELEGINNPGLLLDGYFNLYNLVKEARFGTKFLFLGYKGSGKSAISEHLKLVANQDENLFVTSISLSDLPYSQMKRIIWGDIEPEAKYPTAWAWLILLSFYESFSKDQSLTSKFPLDFTGAIDTLRATSLLPLPTWRQIILLTSKRSFSIKPPNGNLSEFGRNFIEGGNQIPFFVDKLHSIACTIESKAKHLIIIDGLDDILTNRIAQLDALAALILEVSRLNLSFQRAQTPAKVIVLCRTDLYEKLPGANKNKIRQDSALQLDWYHDPRQPEETNLVQLLNLRANLANPTHLDIFTQYFPTTVEERHIITFLLELTRHTPRDVIQLMKHIQQFSGLNNISKSEVLSGVRSYSVDYFLPEIKDELVGFVSEQEIKDMIDVIGALRKRDFDFGELKREAKKQERYSYLNIDENIRLLFECSAIGNVHSRGNQTFYTFKYRNRNSTLNIEDRLILHRGMWKAMNLV